MSTLTQSAPFTNGQTEYRTHYRFSQPKGGECYVAIHIGCYCKQLSWLQRMFEHLKSQIPFEVLSYAEPEVEVLAGPCYKQMPSVQVLISFGIPDSEAAVLLKVAGFYEGLEYTLG